MISTIQHLKRSSKKWCKEDAFQLVKDSFGGKFTNENFDETLELLIENQFAKLNSVGNPEFFSLPKGSQLQKIKKICRKV